MMDTAPIRGSWQGGGGRTQRLAMLSLVAAILFTPLLPGLAGAGEITSSSAEVGPGKAPGPTVQFLVRPARVYVGASGQRVFVVSSAALGTVERTSSGLDLSICSQRDGLASPLIVRASKVIDLFPQPDQRLLFTLSHIFTAPAPGTYYVGLCGKTDKGDTDPSWTNNDYGYTTAIVFSAD